jgi:hypothetical protein
MATQTITTEVNTSQITPNHSIRLLTVFVNQRIMVNSDPIKLSIINPEKISRTLSLNGSIVGFNTKFHTITEVIQKRKWIDFIVLPLNNTIVFMAV